MFKAQPRNVYQSNYISQTGQNFQNISNYGSNINQYSLNVNTPTNNYYTSTKQSKVSPQSYNSQSQKEIQEGVVFDTSVNKYRNFKNAPNTQSSLVSSTIPSKNMNTNNYAPLNNSYQNQNTNNKIVVEEKTKVLMPGEIMEENKVEEIPLEIFKETITNPDGTKTTINKQNFIKKTVINTPIALPTINIVKNAPQLPIYKQTITQEYFTKTIPSTVVSTLKYKNKLPMEMIPESENEGNFNEKSASSKKYSENSSLKSRPSLAEKNKRDYSSDKNYKIISDSPGLINAMDFENERISYVIDEKYKKKGDVKNIIVSKKGKNESQRLSSTKKEENTKILQSLYDNLNKGNPSDNYEKIENILSSMDDKEKNEVLEKIYKNNPKNKKLYNELKNKRSPKNVNNKENQITEKRSPKSSKSENRNTKDNSSNSKEKNYSFKKKDNQNIPNKKEKNYTEDFKINKEVREKRNQSNSPIQYQKQSTYAGIEKEKKKNKEKSNFNELNKEVPAKKEEEKKLLKSTKAKQAPKKREQAESTSIDNSKTIPAQAQRKNKKPIDSIPKPKKEKTSKINSAGNTIEVNKTTRNNRTNTEKRNRIYSPRNREVNDKISHDFEMKETEKPKKRAVSKKMTDTNKTEIIHKKKNKRAEINIIDDDNDSFSNNDKFKKRTYDIKSNQIRKNNLKRPNTSSQREIEQIEKKMLFPAQSFSERNIIKTNKGNPISIEKMEFIINNFNDNPFLGPSPYASTYKDRATIIKQEIEEEDYDQEAY